MLVLGMRGRSADGVMQGSGAQIDELEVAVLVDATIAGLDVVDEHADLGRLIEPTKLLNELGGVYDRGMIQRGKGGGLLVGTELANLLTLEHVAIAPGSAAEPARSVDTARCSTDHSMMT